MSMIHLEDNHIDMMLEQALNSADGTASDGCGGRFDAQDLFYESQNRYARKWFFAHRNGQLTQEMADCPPSNQSWEDYIS